MRSGAGFHPLLVRTCPGRRSFLLVGLAANILLVAGLVKTCDEHPEERKRR